MSVGLTPKVQIDALPLFTVGQATVNGTLQVIGSTEYLAFTGAQLGLNGTPMTAHPPLAPLSLVTPFLNLAGMNYCVFTLRYRNNVAGHVAYSVTALCQFRQGPADAPGYPSALYTVETGAQAIGGGTYNTVVAGVSQTLVFAFSPFNPDSNAVGNYCGAAGTGGVRFFIFGGGAMAADDLFYGYLEASS